MSLHLAEGKHYLDTRERDLEPCTLSPRLARYHEPVMMSETLLNGCSSTRGWNLRLAGELTNMILDEAIWQCLEARDFGAAWTTMTANVGALRRWCVRLIGPSVLDTAGKDGFIGVGSQCRLLSKLCTLLASMSEVLSSATSAWTAGLTPVLRMSVRNHARPTRVGQEAMTPDDLVYLGLSAGATVPDRRTCVAMKRIGMERLCVEGYPDGAMCVSVVGPRWCDQRMWPKTESIAANANIIPLLVILSVDTGLELYPTRRYTETWRQRPEEWRRWARLVEICFDGVKPFIGIPEAGSWRFCDPQRREKTIIGTPNITIGAVQVGLDANFF